MRINKYLLSANSKISTLNKSLSIIFTVVIPFHICVCCLNLQSFITSEQYLQASLSPLLLFFMIVIVVLLKILPTTQLLHKITGRLHQE